MCTSYQRAAMAYVHPLLSLRFLSLPSPPLPFPLHQPIYSTRPPTHLPMPTHAKPALFGYLRFSNGNKTIPASGPSTAISPGMSPADSTPTSWSGRRIFKMRSFRRRRIKTVGTGRAFRAGICCRRLTRGCKGIVA